MHSLRYLTTNYLIPVHQGLCHMWTHMVTLTTHHIYHHIKAFPLIRAHWCPTTTIWLHNPGISLWYHLQALLCAFVYHLLTFAPTMAYPLLMKKAQRCNWVSAWKQVGWEFAGEDLRKRWKQGSIRWAWVEYIAHCSLEVLWGCESGGMGGRFWFCLCYGNTLSCQNTVPITILSSWSLPHFVEVSLFSWCSVIVINMIIYCSLNVVLCLV